MLPEEIMSALAESLPAILNTRDICSFLKVSSETVHREIARPGGLKGFKAEGEWNVARADFLEYLEHHGTL